MSTPLYSKYQWDNVTATTSSVDLETGVYWLEVVDGATGSYPTWNLQKLGEDGSSWFNVNGGAGTVLLQLAAANAPGTNYVTPLAILEGTYRFSLKSGTPLGSYIMIQRLVSAA